MFCTNNREIDVNFDFTTDTPHYWDSFWLNNHGLGSGGNDPDAASKTLQRYHKLLWSKPLPCGQVMDLSIGTVQNYLTWNGFRFGSDSITASFRYKRYHHMLRQVEAAVPDYKSFVEDYIHQAYTIGGAIIFPKRMNSINQKRGTTASISDRWDLTLECIRRFYLGEQSPLYETLLQDKAFFDLFVDFKGYVDFFYLQDCVSDDCSRVKFWSDVGSFSGDPLPKSVSDYLHWIDYQLKFVHMRNLRIDTAVNHT